MIRFIVAIDEKHGLADEQGIPWQGKIPTDVAHFRKNTLHSVVMMGYGWYVEQKRPLPERRNLVATSKTEELRPGFERVSDARAYLQAATTDIWVGGGASLFSSTLDLADELYITQLSGDFKCTKFFPPYSDQFQLVDRSQPVTENNIKYCFEIWQPKARS